MTIKTPAAFICDILCLSNKWRLKLEVENDIDEALKNNCDQYATDLRPLMKISVDL